MTKPTAISSVLQSSAKTVLESALSQDFHSVIVFGFKDGQIKTLSSPTADRLKIIGALEAAKIHIWET